jgi:hypothetical protein
MGNLSVNFYSRKRKLLLKVNYQIKPQRPKKNSKEILIEHLIIVLLTVLVAKMCTHITPMSILSKLDFYVHKGIIISSFTNTLLLWSIVLG